MNFNTLFPDIRKAGNTEVRRCHLVMIRMMKIFDYLCQKHGINYWMAYGTLLGAVRHQGFIPWDQDVDIAMCRADYNRFLAEIITELPEDILFQSPDNESGYDPRASVQAKLRDRYSNYYMEWEARPYLRWHNGLMIDIFVYDYFLPLEEVDAYNSPAARRKRIAKLNPNVDYDIAMAEEDVFPLCRLEFEGVKLPAPNHYNKYLHFVYGDDFIQIPPPDQRVSYQGAASATSACLHKESLLWRKHGSDKSTSQIQEYLKEKKRHFPDMFFQPSTTSNYYDVFYKA